EGLRNLPLAMRSGGALAVRGDALQAARGLHGRRPVQEFVRALEHAREVGAGVVERPRPDATRSLSVVGRLRRCYLTVLALRFGVQLKEAVPEVGPVVAPNRHGLSALREPSWAPAWELRTGCMARAQCTHVTGPLATT